jgi:hypothetical protein
MCLALPVVPTSSRRDLTRRCRRDQRRGGSATRSARDDVPLAGAVVAGPKPVDAEGADARDHVVGAGRVDRRLLALVLARSSAARS